VQKQAALDIPGFFPYRSPNKVKSYKNEIIQAIRTSDIDLLRSFHRKGEDLSCSNLFGESILHMACRRGLDEVVTFLLEEVSDLA